MNLTYPVRTQHEHAGHVLGLQRFLDTNIVAIGNRNTHIGGHVQREAPMRMGSRSGGILVLNILT